jgi:glycosyltransferase involved in cell wall biosynthesis
LRPLLARLRRWDRAVSVRVDRFVAISAHVQRRIHAFYGRDSDIVYPPVDTERCTPGPSDDGEFDLVVSALVPYKRVDLAVRAYAQLPGRRLVVVGVGTDQSALQRIAPPNVTFLGWQTDDAVLDLYRRCRLLVFPGEEDFGIVPLEAQACGRPVVAYGCGGVLETVRDGETGIHFHAQTPDCLADAVNRCGATTWDRSAIRRHAEKFSVSVFIAGLESAMLRVLS